MQHRSLLTALRWLVYSLGAIVVLTCQQSILSRLPIGQAVACLVPVAVAMVAFMEGPEAGSLFGLCFGLLWFWASARYGPMYLFLLPLSAALVGKLSQTLFVRRFFPSVLMSLLALLLCEGPVQLLQLYLGMGQPLVFLVELVYSLAFACLFYPIVCLISRLGGTKWNNAADSVSP